MVEFGAFSLFAIVGLGLFVVWVWALIDVLRVPSDANFRAGTQLIWVIIIVFANLIGALIYLVVGRPAPPLRR